MRDCGGGDVAGLGDTEDLRWQKHRPRASFLLHCSAATLSGIKKGTPMKGAVTTPTGNIGKVVANELVATQDIGRAAAARLLDSTWTGRAVANLLGHADLSFDDAAAAIGRGIGTPVTHVHVPEAHACQAMTQPGMGDDAIRLMLELYRAMASGLLQLPEGRTAESTTPTTMEQFARQVLTPMMGSAS